MSYRLQWNDSAARELIDAWIKADSHARGLIASAIRSLEHELVTNPEETGESRSGADRIAFEAPIAVIFEIDRPARLVRIVQAWRY